MKKYFIYGNEYISGWRYWWRQFLQTILVAFFGLGLYLGAVTTYKRSRSLENSHTTALILAIYQPISIILAFAIGYESGYSGDDSLLFFNLLLNIPHWYLWFSNGNPPIQNNIESLKDNSKDSLIESNDNIDNKTEIITKNNENMKGFKQCEKGHFYKDNLSECNYCPKTESSSENKTEILNTDNSTNGDFSEKTQVFGATTQQSPNKNESFDPERTIISGSNSNNNSDDSNEKIIQKRKLRAWLVSFDLEDFGVDFKVLEGKNTIGSKSSNDITVQDNEVSGLQGIILCRKDKFFLTDEVSSNGTLLNDNDLEPRKPYEIHDGDKIKIGSTTLLFKTAF